MRGGGASAKLADRRKRGLDVGAARPESRRRARSRDRLRRQALLLIRDRHRHDASRQPGEIPQERLAVLAGEHADDQHERPRDALLEIADRARDGAAAVGVVAAVEPQLAARRRAARPACPARAAACAPATPPWRCRSRTPRRRACRPARRAASRSRRRHFRTDGGRTAAAPAGRAGRRRPDRPDARAPR